MFSVEFERRGTKTRPWRSGLATLSLIGMAVFGSGIFFSAVVDFKSAGWFVVLWGLFMTVAGAGSFWNEHRKDRQQVAGMFLFLPLVFGAVAVGYSIVHSMSKEWAVSAVALALYGLAFWAMRRKWKKV